MILLDAWAPLFAVNLGIPRPQMEDMSVPLLVDHLDHWNESRGAGRGSH
jgi:hypothetical protein